MSVEIRAARQGERPQICDLINLAFATESYGPSPDHPCTSVGDCDLDPHDRAENSRILLVDGQIVSVVHVAEREAYAAGERFPFGFVGMVATHPRHRGRGHMRRLMTDASDYMRSRGFCYGLLLGTFSSYGGSLGWRSVAQHQPTLAWKQVVLARLHEGDPADARLANVDDVAFMSGLYQRRYSHRFGAVVRSPEYWRRWSLHRPWEGVYVIVHRHALPSGYFHIGHDVDEIGWIEDSQETQEAVLRAPLAWAAREGNSAVGFYTDDSDELLNGAIERVFGRLEKTYTTPWGKPTAGNSPDPAPYRQQNWPEGGGLLVKFLNAGPGILASTSDTDSLTEAMARHHWTCFDGDAI